MLYICICVNCHTLYKSLSLPLTLCIELSKSKLPHTTTFNSTVELMVECQVRATLKIRISSFRNQSRKKSFFLMFFKLVENGWFKIWNFRVSFILLRYERIFVGVFLCKLLSIFQIWFSFFILCLMFLKAYRNRLRRCYFFTVHWLICIFPHDTHIVRICFSNWRETFSQRRWDLFIPIKYTSFKLLIISLNRIWVATFQKKYN